jgi:hypothetical protein
LYAAGCILSWQMFGEREWLTEAANALRTIHALPPHMLTHEPQQLSFGAAAARALQRLTGPELGGNDWGQVAADLVGLSLRMGYWGPDAAVPQYDPRGMFQACASLCYPAFKENVETLLPWPELLRGDTSAVEDEFTPSLRRLMAAFANLGRCHNGAFFDPQLPAELRRGPCASIPYEDVATAEFPYTATLGKELYGAGEVLWSALLFDTFGQVDAANPDVLCFSLDVPALDMNAFTNEAWPGATGPLQFLVCNPAATTRRVTVTTRFGPQEVVLEPDSCVHLSISESRR